MEPHSNHGHHDLQTFHGIKLGARAGRSDPTGRTEAFRELCERMPDA
jgi:hypothetical protein